MHLKIWMMAEDVEFPLFIGTDVYMITNLQSELKRASDYIASNV